MRFAYCALHTLDCIAFSSQWRSEALYYISLANPFTHAVELIRFALYGEFEPIAAAVVAGSTVVFFMLAVIGYNPQRGLIRRAPQPAWPTS
jgi:ABC-2 type transport system permease protein